MNQAQQMNESLGHPVDEAKDVMKFANQLMTAASRLDVASNRSKVGPTFKAALAELNKLTSRLLDLAKDHEDLQ